MRLFFLKSWSLFMKLAQLILLVKKGESEQLEFKSTTSNIVAGIQTLCAFLNSEKGGSVVFGVTDYGDIKGQNVSDSTKKNIANELNKIEPRPSPKVDVIYVPIKNNNEVIILKTKAGENAPYTYDGRAYVRNQSTTSRMSKEEYVYLHNQNNQTLWESLTGNTCKLSDLDLNRIKEMVRMAVYEKRMPESAMSESIPDVLQKLEIAVNGKLTNAAVVLFCKNENKQFLQCNIKLARFKGIDKTEFLDTKTFRGNAFDMYDKAMDFLSFTLPVAARIEDNNPTRVETPAIPYKVLREAVTNAIIHRDYSQAGGSISIAVYDDRVNISNIGALPKGVELNQLSKEHQSILRNPLIAQVFYLCGKIEKWGRGTIEMINDCKKVGNSPPKYEEIGGGFSLTLPLKESINSVIKQQLSDHDLSKLTDRQKKIIEILRQGALTTTQLIKKMRSKLTTRTMQLELVKLRELNLIKSTGKTKATLWLLSEYNYEIIAK